MLIVEKSMIIIIQINKKIDFLDFSNFFDQCYICFIYFIFFKAFEHSHSACEHANIYVIIFGESTSLI